MSPIAASTPPAAPPPPALVRVAAGAPAGWSAYTVRAGDTLVDIARRLGTTPSVLAAQNDLPNGGRLIRTGSVLLVPGTAGPAPDRAPGAPAAPGSTAYTVRAGDTVSQIALRTPATARQIMAANDLGPRSGIRAGQVLQIPGQAPATASTAPAVVVAPAPDRGPNTFAGRSYPDATVAAAAAARDALRRSGAPSRAAMRSIIDATARRYGVEPRLALAIAYQESGWDQRQVSVANAVGALQVIPSSGQWASFLVGRPLDLLRAEDNAMAGVVLLRALTRSSVSLDEAIAGYYQGLASVRANGMYADTKQYVANVHALMDRV